MEGSSMYDFKISLQKGAKALAISLGSVAAGAVLGYLADPANVTKALQGSVAPAVAAGAAIVLPAIAHTVLNWLKNR